VRGAASREHPRICLATVVSGDLGYGIVRMWYGHAESVAWRCRLFRDRAEADRWLREEVDPALTFVQRLWYRVQRASHWVSPARQACCMRRSGLRRSARVRRIRYRPQRSGVFAGTAIAVLFPAFEVVIHPAPQPRLVARPFP
jgi:hypothetical protein